MHTCEVCGVEYKDNEMYYDDTCDDCAREEGILK